MVPAAVADCLELAVPRLGRQAPLAISRLDIEQSRPADSGGGQARAHAFVAVSWILRL